MSFPLNMESVICPFAVGAERGFDALLCFTVGVWLMEVVDPFHHDLSDLFLVGIGHV